MKIYNDYERFEPICIQEMEVFMEKTTRFIFDDYDELEEFLEKVEISNGCKITGYKEVHPDKIIYYRHKGKQNENI